MFCFLTLQVVYWTTTGRKGWSCLPCVYPQLFNQGVSACQQHSNRILANSASTKWGRTGLILFELQHLSELYDPIRSQKQGGKGGQQGGVVGRCKQEVTAHLYWGHNTGAVFSKLAGFNMEWCKAVMLTSEFLFHIVTWSWKTVQMNYNLFIWNKPRQKFAYAAFD